MRKSSISNAVLDRVIRGGDMTPAETRDLVDGLVAGTVPEAMCAALLVALRIKGETASELVGAAAAMRDLATKPPLSGPADLDTCGTGGDGSGSLNISTAAALVAAADGVRVAKHGNRANSSRCGSADVVEAMGIPIDLAPEHAADAIQSRCFAFLFAPQYHAATRAIVALRRALGVRTLFNMLGPLTNPAGVRAQLVGVYHPDRAMLMAEALKMLGTERALVVASALGLDEIAPNGPTRCVRLDHGRISIGDISPEDFGIEATPLEAIKGGDAAENAAALRAILSGAAHPARNAVLINASAALVIAERAGDWREGARRAAELIDTGRVAAKLSELVAVPA